MNAAGVSAYTTRQIQQDLQRAASLLHQHQRPPPTTGEGTISSSSATAGTASGDPKDTTGLLEQQLPFIEAAVQARRVEGATAPSPSVVIKLRHDIQIHV